MAQLTSQSEKHGFSSAGRELHVRTTDGYLVRWDRKKIVESLLRETALASKVAGVPSITREEATKISKRVESRVRRMQLKLVSAPLIRELVNNVLIELSSEEKRFLVYRNFYTRVGAPVYDSYQIDLGLGFEAKENANLQPNPESSHKKKADRVSKEQYLLMMPPDMADAHLRGDIHIHDLEYFGTRSFCMDHDLRYFLYYGFMPDGNGLRASVAKPARHAEVAILHSVKVLAAAQTNFAGGQGFFNYLVFLAPYMRGLNRREVEQLMQMMFYELTQTYVSRGGQLVFSNIQVQPGVPEIWRDKPVVARGRVGPDTYGEYEDEVATMFEALHRVALEGDAWGKPFNFPKLEEQLAPEFLNSHYEDAWLLAHRAVARHGTPYFDNLIPAYRGYGKGVSCYQCCAYCFTDTPETDEKFHEKMYFEDGEHFSMGGWQVVSMNLPRAAYAANGDDGQLTQEMRSQVDLAVRVFQLKRHWMHKMMEQGRIPFVSQRPLDPHTRKKGSPLVDLDSLVYTVGFVGVNEMVQHHTGSQLHESRDAVKLALRALIETKDYVEEKAKQTGLTLGLARTPAESTAQIFAVADLMNEKYREKAKKTVKGDLQTTLRQLNGTRDLPVFYTNGTHINVAADVTLAEKIDVEQKFFPLLDGGNIFHIWLGEAHSGAEALYKTTKKIARTNIGYFAYTKDLTICDQCGATMAGIHEQCLNCNSKNVSIWSRITGYYQNVSGWNEAKRAELRLRHRMGSL